MKSIGKCKRELLEWEAYLKMDGAAFEDLECFSDMQCYLNTLKAILEDIDNPKFMENMKRLSKKAKTEELI